ncbi:MAG: MBOAT family protein [Magnetococcales bacterium]|nr:MBOAT family protein [Magnetococcales bacterium]
MLLSSWEYLLFFLVVLFLSIRTLGLPRLRLWILLLASYYFYASSNGWQVWLIFFSTQVDYVAGLALARETAPLRRRVWLAVSLASNLGLLAFFKYLNFFASAVAELAGHLGWTLGWVDLNILLPVGISFYTFQTMSYTIDVYRGTLAAEHSWVRFMFFVAFFPQLTAGPIVRAAQFLPQTRQSPSWDLDTVENALFLIFRGLGKKIVLADSLALHADLAFDPAAGADVLQRWLGVYAFTFQIYFDFSGYTDIAIGSAALLGYRLPDNFNRPYAAASITDFWRRWHMSLSSWLRDYLYIPLGGSRMATTRGVYRNLMLTMLLGGLWHGAAWTFMVWGGVHGVLLCLERWWRGAAKAGVRAGWGRRLLVFNLVAFTWIPFRAASLGDLGQFLAGLADVGHWTAPDRGMLAAATLMVLALGFQSLGERWDYRAAFLRSPLPLQSAVYAAILMLVLVFNLAETQPFIYFRF